MGGYSVSCLRFGIDELHGQVRRSCLSVSHMMILTCRLWIYDMSTADEAPGVVFNPDNGLIFGSANHTKFERVEIFTAGVRRLVFVHLLNGLQSADVKTTLSALLTYLLLFLLFKTETCIGDMTFAKETRYMCFTGTKWAVLAPSPTRT